MRLAQLTAAADTRFVRRPVWYGYLHDVCYLSKDKVSVAVFSDVHELLAHEACAQRSG
jgi:hypothetical protein